MECGRRVLQHKQLITNGFAAQEGDWPWHAAIYHTSDSKFHEQSYKCGSTLISAGAVLTAAHCVYESGHPIIAERVIVHVGKYDFGLADPHTQQFNVHRIIIHSGFTPTNLLDDIAIIRLATQAIFTAYVKPICLWNSQRTAITEVIGKVGIVVGWGLNERDQLTKQLSQAHIPVVSSITCLQSDPSTYGSFITEKTFCAGWRNGKYFTAIYEEEVNFNFQILIDLIQKFAFIQAPVHVMGTAVAACISQTMEFIVCAALSRSQSLEVV